MRLFRYDLAELREAAEAYVAALPALDRAAAHTADPQVWDELTLDWWCALAAEGARVDAAPALPHLTAPVRAEVDWPGPRATSRRGPVTLAHRRAPPFSDGSPYGYAYWRAAVETERLELLLAMQIEWGGGGRPAARFGRAMLAAADLAPVEARAKAVLVATDGEGERRRLVEQLGALRLASWDPRPWLWIDVPWRVDRAEHPPAWGLLEG